MAKNAHLEALAEPLTAEENGLMEANRDSEHTAPDSDPTPAPEPEERPAPVAPKAEAQPDIDPETGKQRKVDYGAFHSERERRKTADAENQKLKEEIAKFNGRFETLQQLARQPKPQEAQQEQAIPDVNVDPVGHFQAVNAQLRTQLEGVSKWRETQESNATAMNNVRELTSIAMRHETEFSKTTPDYQDAAAYVRQARDQELDYMGYKDPAVRNQIIQQDALQIAAQALQGNLNAAEVVYNIAKARGYQAKAPAPVPAAPVPAPIAASPDASKLKTVAKGQSQASPISQVNGTAQPEVSIESLLKMSDADFEEATKGDKWQKMMGG